MIQIIPIEGIPILSSEEDFWHNMNDKLDGIVQDNDILVCAHTPISRIWGPIYRLNNVDASKDALELADILKKDPKNVQVILNESKSIVKTGRNVIVTENHAGVVCANGGVDYSNAGIGNLIGVPHNPDKFAKKIRSFLKTELGVNIAVVISDTVGRALRRGAVNIGIGVAGIEALRSERGKKDLFGYEMRVSEIAIADELASAAELVQGQTDEGIPIVIIRGYQFNFKEETTARILNRPEEERIFR